METLTQFYNEIFNKFLRNEKYDDSCYLYPMDVATFNTAYKDFKNRILRNNNDEILDAINKEYDNSPIIFSIEKSYMQRLLKKYQSKVIAKHEYSKIDFLSLLTSFKTIQDQISFIRDVLVICETCKKKYNILEEIKFKLSIDIIKYSQCQSIKIQK